VTGAPLPEDPRDALIREEAERIADRDRQLARVAVQEERVAALEAVVAGPAGAAGEGTAGAVAEQR
jgi:hypothetical protein